MSPCAAGKSPVVGAERPSADRGKAGTFATVAPRNGSKESSSVKTRPSAAAPRSGRQALPRREWPTE